MGRLREISDRVKSVLEANKESRNSDNVLYLHVLRSYGEEKGLDIDKMSVPMLFLHCRDLGLPTLESVGRARRKVQELNPHLRGDDAVQVSRELNEEVYRQYAKEVHYVWEMKIVKDTECLHCKKFFDCKGKPKSNVSCVSYEERKKDGRC